MSFLHSDYMLFWNFQITEKDLPLSLTIKLSFWSGILRGTLTQLECTHSYGFFLACLWMCMCLFKQTALINSFEHKSHVTTDSLVCSSLCAFKLSRRVKAEPQSSQMNFFSFLCPAMCLLRSALLTNALSHSVHLCRLSPDEKRQVLHKI